MSEVTERERRGPRQADGLNEGQCNAPGVTSQDESRVETCRRSPL